MGQSSTKLIKVYGPPRKPALWRNPLAWVAAVLLFVIIGLLVFGDRDTPLALDDESLIPQEPGTGAGRTEMAQSELNQQEASDKRGPSAATAHEPVLAEKSKSEPILEEIPAPTAMAPRNLTNVNVEGEEARRYIQSVRSHGDAQDLGAVFRRAGEMAANGKQTDAYLLYFFAAREGHAASAFVLAGLSDPNHYRPGANLSNEPDPLQSLKWYRVAASDGYAEAQTRLRELHQWVQDRAQAGDTRAQQLLLSFR